MQIPDRFDKYGLAIDAAAHWLHCYSLNEIASDRYTLDGCECKICGSPLIYRYHESTLYTICCKKCQYTMQLEASNPYDAARFVSATGRNVGRKGGHGNG